MSETKFTPGPWEAQGTYVRVPDQTLADVFLIDSHAKFEDRHGEAQANARLMAAAPEMYEALKWVRALYRPSDESNMVKAIDAALSKAVKP